MGSIKTIKNTNNFSIFNWIPWSSYGMTEVKLIRATRNSRESGHIKIIFLDSCF
ncbi:hypothetical protein [Rickettsia australis]|uniref:hypothetical protein n=1 Tax=Rickettsia australis TaxID=787 RepID=UPI0003165A15|nr:hypothetical protein [Rickettsia australis]